MASKKYLRKIWDEFVYGGHLLSLGGSAIIYSVMLVLKLDTSLPLIFIM